MTTSALDQPSDHGCLPFHPLGDVPLTVFLDEYWQQRPCLLRQCLANTPFADPATLITVKQLLALAKDDAVESRMISVQNGQWQLKHGPCKRLPAKTQANWTVLVQGVNLHMDSIDQYLQAFRFIPDAQLDDIMISYATDGGGVGAHFDSYDVFLLQIHGRRRWRISAQDDLSLQPDKPVKLLATFTPEQEFLLEPGDMLYLPARYAHEGVAQGECMTLSVGFRAPTANELMAATLRTWADQLESSDEHPAGHGVTRYPGHRPSAQESQHPAHLPANMLGWLKAQMAQEHPPLEAMEQALLSHLTEPKPNIFFDAPEQSLRNSDRTKRSLMQTGLACDRRTRMMYLKHPHQCWLAINGEINAFSDKQAQTLLPMLADQRCLPGSSLQSLPVDHELWSWLVDMINAGWLQQTVTHSQPQAH